MQMMRFLRHRLRWPCVLFLLAFLPSTGVQAEVTRMVAKSSGPMGSYGGREYIYVMADMHGNIEREDGRVGRYRVPVVLMYPDRNPNGFGFVDLINSASFSVYEEGEAPEGKRSVYHVGDIVFSDYLRREGFSYIAVQWARMVTRVLGPDYGVVEDGRDAFPIIKDAANFLRAPAELGAAVAFQPQGVQWVVSFGHSQTAELQRQFVRSGNNREEDGSLVFDGLLVSTAGGECLIPDNDDTPRQRPGRPSNPRFHTYEFCVSPLPEDGKYIAIESQSELDWGMPHQGRQQTANYRQYELAGVAHIPPDLIDLRLAGATRQNPVSFRAFYKATLRNLVEWVANGTPPPDSAYIDGKAGAEGKFGAATDADGNVEGGVRLPHMTRVLANGELAGAPLGVYGGVEPKREDDVFVWLGGTFQPFSDEALARRYPSRQRYVELVRKSAAALLAERFILPEDYDAYVKSAAYWHR